MTRALLTFFGITRPYLAEIIAFPVSSARKRQSEDLFLQANAIDENPDRWEEAMFLYHRAIRLDPSHAEAITNLANLHYYQDQKGTAEILYRQALKINPYQPYAHYNLGVIAYEDAELLVAICHFECVIKIDPKFSDAHFNLACALEETGQKQRARKQFKKFLEIEPCSQWSDEARQRLARLF